MSVSLVINTCALGPQAAETLSSGKVPHDHRVFLLRNIIIPQAVASYIYDEVIVVGEWEPGPGYRYIEVPSEQFDCTDALQQRHVGATEAKGDWIIHQHDDHMFGGVVFAPRVIEKTGANILSPARFTRMRSAEPEKLNAGEGKYVLGHGAIYLRSVLEAAPWANVPKVFTWDVEHTKQLKAAGGVIAWTPLVYTLDVEYGAKPWQ